jgi:hypothetical protein
MFKYVPERAEYRAEFVVDGELADAKFLTQLEEDNLEEFLGEENIGKRHSFTDLLQYIDEGLWVREDDFTNFEKILYELQD